MEDLNYKLSFVPSLETNSGPIEMRSATLEQAKQELDIIANYTLFLHDKGLMRDYSNTSWIKKLVDGEWEDVDTSE